MCQWRVSEVGLFNAHSRVWQIRSTWSLRVCVLTHSHRKQSSQGGGGGCNIRHGPALWPQGSKAISLNNEEAEVRRALLCTITSLFKEMLLSLQKHVKLIIQIHVGCL